MKIVSCLILITSLAGVSAAQAPSQQQTPEPSSAGASPASPANPPRVMHFDPGTVIRVHLDTAIDVKKARGGDQVLATTTDDLKSNPPGLATKGCKVFGHIVEVTPREGDSPSKLRIAFDK